MKHVHLISRNLKKINTLYTKILSKELSAHDLDQHYEVLLLVHTHEKAVTQNKLAEMLQIDKSRMANIIFYLESKELIYTKINPADRREHYVYLSSTAETAIPEIQKAVEKINGIVEQGIAPEKLDVFFEVSERMQQNLQSR